MPERSSVKVHLGISEKKQAELLAQGGSAVMDFAQRLGLTDVKAGRFELFGVLTGLADPARLSTLQHAEGVEFVERDARKDLVATR